MSITERLSSIGFDSARLRFGTLTAIAACLALAISWMLGLQHPQWSAMAVWVASQPVRGALLEKGFFRVAGTMIGSLAGIAIVKATGGVPLWLVPALALWVGLCVGTGNVLRGFVGYGALLAGYSASMVALLDAPHPDHIVPLGIDRMLTTLVGVLVALAIGLIFAENPADALVRRARALTVRLLRDMATRLATPADDRATFDAEHRAILSEMALIEEGLDPHGAGSRRSRRSAKTMRAILVAQVGALLWLRRHDTAVVDPALPATLGRAADLLEQDAPATSILEAMERATTLARGHDALHRTIGDLATALRERFAFREGSGARPADPAPVILHRDWVSARHAGLRAAGTLLLVGAVWVASGWSAGPYVMLGTAVMISLFSTFDTPGSIMVPVLLGQVAGAVAALACEWLVWPAATGAAGLIVMMMPFILFGAVIFGHRRTAMGSPDYNLVMLLLLEPIFPLTATFEQSLGKALAVVAAPVIALWSFRLAFPTSPRHRLDRLIAAMIHELQDMADDPAAIARVRVWHARLYHRVLMLTRWADKAGIRDARIADGAMTVLLVGETVLRLHELEAAPSSASLRRASRLARARIRRLTADPGRAQTALSKLIPVVARHRGETGALVADTARAMAANADFFHRAA